MAPDLRSEGAMKTPSLDYETSQEFSDLPRTTPTTSGHDVIPDHLPTLEDLEEDNLTKAELYDYAREMEIGGRSTMNKQELLEAIQEGYIDHLETVQSDPLDKKPLPEADPQDSSMPSKWTLAQPDISDWNLKRYAILAGLIAAGAMASSFLVSWMVKRTRSEESSETATA